ncbi:hypothetical protein [Sphingorhabdus sp. Alg239-R122]|uniref:hypothetical protein n=1 Tax=Sphingorhabdus sp. Alg239-R122 TaxID=2305989 RepID=UPI0013DAB92D|nr:hypothetical protein [Sphingorhabdus sp. Alg239-R122]
MKTVKAAAVAIITALSVGTAFADNTEVIRVDAPRGGESSEVGYPKGALGYDAMVERDYKTAITQIERGSAAHDDPARLINLGQAYAKTGRLVEGRELVLAALEGKKQFDLVLANGGVMNSRTVAKIALDKMDRKLAAR